MALLATDIAAKITAAFPAKRPPGLAIVQTDGPRYHFDEYAQTESVFRDKDDWTSIDPAFLNDVAGSAALCFMSDAATRFYISAYMIADLEGALRAADPAFMLHHGFDDESATRVRAAVPLQSEPIRPAIDFGAIARRKWEPLTTAQVEAVTAYLEWIVERDGLVIADRAEEALATYWRARANR